MEPHGIDVHGREDIVTLTVSHALSCLKMDRHNGHIYGNDMELSVHARAKGTSPLFPSPPAAWVRG